MTEPNWQNRTLWTGDNIDIMRGMNSESVDLIYLDPPFNSNRNYSASIGSEAAGAEFKDTWYLSDVDEAWHNEIADKDPALYAIIDVAGHSHGKSMKPYLIMMAVRLMEMHRLLKDTGSLYLHCDSTASHYLKILMDGIFGWKQFRNEIVWCYKSGGASKRQFAKKHDIILFYSKSKNYLYNPQTEKSYMKPSSGKNPAQKYHKDINGFYTLTNAKDWWADIGILATSAHERTGYPTQKPLKLLERIIKASTNKGDVILDPFCGSATTLVCSEQLERNWVGIDLTTEAVKLVNIRMKKEELVFNICHRDDTPKRTDFTK